MQYSYGAYTHPGMHLTSFLDNVMKMPGTGWSCCPMQEIMARKVSLNVSSMDIVFCYCFFNCTYLCHVFQGQRNRGFPREGLGPKYLSHPCCRLPGHALAGSWSRTRTWTQVPQYGKLTFYRCAKHPPPDTDFFFFFNLLQG